MDISIEQEGRIIDYLKGNMTPEELSAFEIECQNNAELREEVEYYKDIAVGIQRHSSREDALRQLLNEAEQAYSSKAEKPIVPARHVFILRWTSYAVAASVAIVACTGGFLGYDAHSVGMGYQFVEDDSKGADPITSKILEGKNAAAQDAIREQLIIKRNQQNGLEQDSDYYQYLETEIQELEFYDAVCDLRRGKYFSGKKKLRVIANAPGAFQKDAQSLLKELF